MVPSFTISFRLAESIVSTIFEETIKRHLTTPGSQLRTQLDPLPLFPIEFGFKKDVYRCTIPVIFIQRLLIILARMWRPATPMCTTSRWRSLTQCSWHEIQVSSTVHSGFSSACLSPGFLDSTSCEWPTLEFLTFPSGGTPIFSRSYQLEVRATSMLTWRMFEWAWPSFCATLKNLVCRWNTSGVRVTVVDPWYTGCFLTGTPLKSLSMENLG